MQINELKAEVVRNGLTMGEVADLIGMQRTTLWRRFNDPAGFTVGEIRKLKETLNLSGQRILDIFFYHEVS